MTLPVPPQALAGLLAILAASAVMSGLSGFGFSAIGALSLTLLPPKLGVPLLMSLSAANQVLSLGQLKADLKPLRAWWPDGPAPYLLGGALGVPVGLAILSSLPTTTLMLTVGVILLAYSAWSLLNPAAGLLLGGGWMSASVVGAAGGVIGGFTAFPGAPVVVWSGLRRLPKAEARAIVQPYIFILQIVSIALLALRRPETFGGAFWTLLALGVPVVLPGTFLGVRLYRRLSDVNFRRITFLLLGLSGAGLLLKALAAILPRAG